ncbi:protein-tyrosine phosphatase-like protein [Vararia minispora EC-137]|uniref:Protein-tyrosine phosphatase-like protein n=1 Tax=Vararia minispora EC-137 TaxID=1314806 RepID=A0ACB8QZN2_9AGAM|nr:protein-tyrosine phosphatase-like protein [Vararia minispora EC-137]
MISFQNMSPEVAEAMCTPMHLILPPAPLTPHSHSGALYLGSISAVLDPSVLQAHHISSLVQVLDVPWLPQSEKDGYECYRLDVLDLESEDLKPHLEDVVDYIDAAIKHGKNVLVHCQQGVSRSAAIVIAYLIRKRSMSYDTASTFVRQRRPCIKPNAGFVRTLKDYERVWRHKTTTPARTPAFPHATVPVH